MTAYYIFIFSVSFITCLMLTSLVRKISINNGWFDRPCWRKVNTKNNMPVLGGLAIYLSFLISITIIFIVFKEEFLSLQRFLGLGIAMLIIVTVGLFDDIKGLTAKTKMLFHILAALIVINAGFQITKITNPFGGPLEIGWLFGVGITVFWIVGITNAINLIDGLDGLAAGIVSIISFTLFFAALRQGNTLFAILALALAGSAGGFLPHNFYPARIFMGDTGSNFLGFILAIITITGSQKGPVAIGLIIPIIALGIPGLDTFLAIIRRSIKRAKISEADNGHIHHRLMVSEKSQKKVVLFLYTLSLCFSLIALSFTDLRGIYAFSALILTFLFTFRTVRNLGMLEL